MPPDSYGERCEQVARAFSAAFVPYVEARLAARGLDPEPIRDAIDAGRKQAADALAAWARRSPRNQRASPLELVREALLLPTAALAARGAEPVARDVEQVAALPGDHFDLAPATSRDLGDEAWQAHVAWGIARAGEVAGMVPRPPSEEASGAFAALVATDLMDRTRIAETGSAAGCEVVVWRNPGAIEAGLGQRTPVVAFVDLTHAAANDAIRRLVAGGVRTIAYGPHVDDLAMAAAGALGAAEVLPRSRFFKRLPGLFPTLV